MFIPAKIKETTSSLKYPTLKKILIFFLIIAS